MTVKELIEILKQENQNAEVVVESYGEIVEAYSLRGNDEGTKVIISDMPF